MSAAISSGLTPAASDRASCTSAFIARMASSCEQPAARSSSYWSSRCCRSSSRMSPGQSGMLHSGNPADRENELAPGVALRGEHVGADGRQTVVATAALSGLLDPAAQNPAALLESVEQRVQRRDAELQQAAGSQFDQLAQLVAVARLVFEERQDEELGTALFQLAIEHPALDVLHSDILCRGI